MTEPVPRAIHQTVQNMLTVLAQMGDVRAIEALKNSDAIEVIDDDDEAEQIQVIIAQSDGDYLVTEHGASFVPKSDLLD